MHTLFKLLPLLLLGVLVFSCELDNYDEPDAMLTGRLVYQGEPIRVEFDRVGYELYQEGFGKVGPLGSAFTPQGEFSHLLFDGEYKMIIPTGQGPFVPIVNATGNPDTTLIDLRGSEDLEIEVTPYWMIRNPRLSAGEGSVSASFGLEQIASGEDAREIEFITLYVSKTAFANSQNNVATTTVGGGDVTDVSGVNLSVAIPEIQPVQNYVFASVGVKFVNVEDLIFSPTERLDF